MTPRSPFQRFMAELRRRHVPQTAAVYAVAAWAAIQFADVVVPNLGWPQWVVTAVIIASGVGFPVMLALTWFLEWGPDGIHRTDPAEAGAEGQRAPGVGYTGTPSGGRSNAPWIAAVAVLAVGIGTAIVVAGVLRLDDQAGATTGPEATASEAPPTRFDRRRQDDSPLPPIPPLHEMTAPGYGDSLTRAITDSVLAGVGEGGDLESLVEMATRLGETVGRTGAGGPVQIMTPGTWRVGAPHPVTPGDTVRIQGVARAQGGVAEVEVDGRVVAENASGPPVLSFEAAWVARGEPGDRRIPITVRTPGGLEVTREFAVTILPTRAGG